MKKNNDITTNNGNNISIFPKLLTGTTTYVKINLIGQLDNEILERFSKNLIYHSIRFNYNLYLYKNFYKNNNINMWISDKKGEFLEKKNYSIVKIRDLYFTIKIRK
ncbi:hypothetical protein H8356DRAFT_1326313 [Neocallimastix lanati (nom. inval.)]|nr:hypothetical protein H8356DRAFT_1326313 [Neocallimastix sp. JGI-2020a]